MKDLLKIFVFGCVVCLSASFGYAQINITINPAPLPEPVMDQPVEEVGPPPVETEPTDMVVVPSEGHPVYLVPGRVGLYFSEGSWYRFWGDAWYRAAFYGGPWAVIPGPPTYIAAVPPDYVLSVPPTYHRVGYRDFHSHWRDWNRNHYWDHQSFYRDHARRRWEHHNLSGYDRYNSWNHNRGWGHDRAFQDRRRDIVHENRDRARANIERNRDRTLDNIDRNRDRAHANIERNRDRVHDNISSNRDRALDNRDRVRTNIDRNRDRVRDNVDRNRVSDRNPGRDVSKNIGNQGHMNRAPDPRSGNNAHNKSGGPHGGGGDTK